MTEIVFFSLEDVLEKHEELIQRYGGSSGVRDMGLLDSAIAMPAAGFGDEYLHKDIYEMAAAYLFHITQNHPFVDGNKRIGAFVAAWFLDINGIELVADEDDYKRIVYSVAQGKLDKVGIADFFRKNCRV